MTINFIIYTVNIHWCLSNDEPNANTTKKMRGDEADDGGAVMNIEAEGPILLSTTVVNSTFVFQQLRQTVERLRAVGAIR